VGAVEMDHELRVRHDINKQQNTTKNTNSTLRTLKLNCEKANTVLERKNKQPTATIFWLFLDYRINVKSTNTRVNLMEHLRL
jgi:hypothetical protein